MKISDNLTTSVVDPKTTKRKYPEARIIVLDDNFNTFEHVANCLVRIIPGISEKNHGYLHSKLIGKFGKSMERSLCAGRTISSATSHQRINNGTN